MHDQFTDADALARSASVRTYITAASYDGQSWTDVFVEVKTDRFLALLDLPPMRSFR